MNDKNKGKLADWLTRREVVKTSAAVGVGAMVATRLGRIKRAIAGTGKSDELRIGLIGCGGRGSGAAEDAIESTPNVRLVAMGDLFPDRLAAARKQFSGNKLADRLTVTDEHAYSGWDCFEKVLKTDIDYVILATPPGFRPMQLKAAIAAGKHVFTEKPMAVDGPGIRTLFEVADEADKKKLSIGVGLQRRHHAGYIEMVKRLKGGAIGQIVGARSYWNQGALWMKPREKSWTDMEWQLRNWLYFNWLSGDHINEQHIHNIDVVNWVLGKNPVAAVGMGGRQQRVDPAFGHIYDHFAIDFEYPGDIHALSMCRQMLGCVNSVSEHFQGATGQAHADNSQFEITGKKKWKFEGKTSPYEQEHADLIAAIRTGKPYNELRRGAESNLTAIMGRMATYTGQRVTWEQALNSQESLMPAELAFGKLPVPPVPVPGKTKFL